MSECQPSDKAKRIIRAMAKAKVEAGVTDAHDIVDAIHAAIAEHTPLSKPEIADIVSGYGVKRQATRTELSERLSQLRRDLKDAYHPNAAADAKNAARQRAIKSEIARIDEQIKNGDFAKAPRAKPAYDEETQRLQVALERARTKADWEEQRLAYKNKSLPARGLARLMATLRASILSSPSVFAHLLGASAQKVASSLFEDATWALLRHVPGMKQLDELAAVEGGGLNLAAHGKGLADVMSKQTLRDIRDKIVKGASDRQILYGGKLEHQTHFPVLDMVGHVHDAVKTPLERYAFARAYTRANDNLRRSLARAGKSPEEIDRAMVSDSAVAPLNALAYAESQAAKMQGKNAIASWYNDGLRRIEQTGDLGAFFGFLLRQETPIIKIPLNIAAEVGRYTGGALPAISRSRAIAERVRMGGPKMTPEEADFIVRNIKKQGVGVGLLTLGALYYQHFGGLWRPGKKSPNPSMEYGDVTIDGHDVSHHWLHGPAVSTMQMGAMMMYVMDEDQKRADKAASAASKLSHKIANFEGGKNASANLAKDREEAASYSKASAALDGIAQASVAAMMDVPLFDVPKDVAKIGGGQWRQVLGEKARDYIPAPIQQYAKSQDAGAKRKPRTVAQEIEMGIPGHGIGPIQGREDVPQH